MKKIAKETMPPPISRRTSLKDLVKIVAAKSAIPADILIRKGRLAKVVEARDRFIRDLASEVAKFLASHPSNVSRVLQNS